MEMKLKFRELIKYRAGALCLIGILSATYLHSTTFMSQFFYHSLILGGSPLLPSMPGWWRCRSSRMNC